MSMTHPLLEMTRECALALRQARATKTPIAPVSETFGIRGADAAYAVARFNTEARIDAGARVVGMKIGLTSVAVQRQLGVDRPDFGLLFDDMEFLDGDVVPYARLVQPKAEAEVAFGVGRDLPAGAPSWLEFLACLDYALPAIEIVDSAIAGWKLTLVDTVADNASSGLYVLGNQPVAIGAVSLGDLTMELHRGDELVSSGNGAACLGHPLRAAYWLAREMADRGQPLRRGQVIMSGALGPMIPVRPGDRLSADLGALGKVSFSFDA
jgi:2-keto-4-pentenoate hydratase